MENLLCAVGCALGLFGIAAAAIIGMFWIIAVAARSAFSEKDERTKNRGRRCEISLKA